MRIADTKASMAVLVVGLLVAVGAGTVIVAANPFGIATNASTDTTQHYNMTVQVGAVVEGKAIPIIGAEVSVWSCRVNETNDSVVITFTRVAHAITGTGGNVTFNLPSDQYIIVANYSGLQSIKRISLDSDMNIVSLLHNYHHEGGHHGDDGQMCSGHHYNHEENENGCQDGD
jgi:hypothetical protein